MMAQNLTWRKTAASSAICKIDRFFGPIAGGRWRRLDGPCPPLKGAPGVRFASGVAVALVHEKRTPEDSANRALPAMRGRMARNSFSSGSLSNLADQHRGRDAELGEQSPDHADREIALPVQDFGDARPRAKHGLEVTPREPLLYHPKFDRLDRIGRIDRKMLALVSVDKRSEDIEPVTLGRTGLRPPQPFDLGQRSLVIRL
jgi:hypothetical protein